MSFIQSTVHFLCFMIGALPAAFRRISTEKVNSQLLISGQKTTFAYKHTFHCFCGLFLLKRQFFHSQRSICWSFLRHYVVNYVILGYFYEILRNKKSIVATTDVIILKCEFKTNEIFFLFN